MIAALYVQRDGIYYGLPDVDPWPAERDARAYPGPHPVVAHPPCERWGRYWSGGPNGGGRFLKGDDGGCFAAAIAAGRSMKSLRLSEADYAAILARKGAKVAQPTGRAVLGKPDMPRKESELERRLVQQLAEAGIREQNRFDTPQVYVNEYVREYYAIAGRNFRLDIAWPHRHLGVEVQGAVHRIKGRHRADIEKRALHLLAGWRVLEVGGAEIRNGRAIEWIKELLK